MVLLRLIFIFVAALCCSVAGQVLRRVFLTNSNQFVVDVIQETVSELERRQWCNLKLQDVTDNVNLTIPGSHLEGQIHYTNGFIVSIQQVDIRRDSLQQVWTTQANNTVRVELRGQLRLHDVTLGWDVRTNIKGNHFYTGTFLHSMMTFGFSIFRNVHTHDTSVQVIGAHVLNRDERLQLMPNDAVADMILNTYVPTCVTPSFAAWSTTILEPIALDIINKTEFPSLCYDCTLQEANEGWFELD